MRSVASARALRGSGGGGASVAAVVARGQMRHRDVRPAPRHRPGRRDPIVRRIHRRVGRRTHHRFFPVGHRRVDRRYAVRSRYPDAMREPVQTRVDRLGRAAAGSVGPTVRGGASPRAAAGSVGPTGTWADGPDAAAARAGSRGRPSPVAPTARLPEPPEMPARRRPGPPEQPGVRPGGRQPEPGRTASPLVPPPVEVRVPPPERRPVEARVPPPERRPVEARERRRVPPACGCC